MGVFRESAFETDGDFEAWTTDQVANPAVLGGLLLAIAHRGRQVLHLDRRRRVGLPGK